MSEERTKISFSKMKTWRGCHKAYDFKYNMKLRRKKKSKPLIVGTIVHEALEAFYLGKDWKKIIKKVSVQYDKLFKEEKEYLDEDIPALCADLVQRYIDHWDADEYTVVAVEQEFDVEISPGIWLNGKIDLICTDSKDRLWVNEHKTCARMPDEAVRMADTQAIIYGDILPRLGYDKPSGVVWDYLRKKVPGIPEKVKKGDRLSKNKGLDTTHTIYLATILEHGFDPADYEEILDSLERKEDAFFKRVQLPLNGAMTKQTLRDAVSTGEQIRDFGKVWKDRNMNKDCGWCDFFTLCQADVRGASIDYMIEHDFELDKRGEKHGSKKENGRKKKESVKGKAKAKQRKLKDPASTRAAASAKRSVVRKKRIR